MKMQGRESEQNPSREDFISYEKKKPWAFLNGIVYYCGKDQWSNNTTNHLPANSKAPQSLNTLSLSIVSICELRLRAVARGLRWFLKTDCYITWKTGKNSLF